MKIIHFDIPVVAAAALDRSDEVLSRWLPDGTRRGHEWVALNPTRADKNPGSFRINCNTGEWADFATDDRGGDLVSLIAYLEGKHNGEAANLLGDFLGLTAAGGADRRRPAPKAQERAAGDAGAKIPAEVLATRPRKHGHFGEPVKTWTYRGPAGETLFYVCRFDDGRGGKTFLPLSWSGEWRYKAPPKPWPLYNLDQIAGRPWAPIFFAEGEKAADAIGGLLLDDMVVTTTPFGSQSPSKSDFAPLKGRQVVIWPDADEAGSKYAESVERLAMESGADSVSVVDLQYFSVDPKTGERRDLPKGWDCADAKGDGWEPEALRAVLSKALAAGAGGDIKSLADEKVARCPPPPAEPGGVAGEQDERPVIQVVSGSLPVAVDEFEAHLIRMGVGVYQHGTRLVRVGRWGASKNDADNDAGADIRRRVTQREGSAMLCDVSESWLIDCGARRVGFERFDARKNKWFAIDCPGKVARSVLSRVGAWKFYEMTGFCDAPTLDQSGRVISSPGFDRDSGLFLSNPPPLPELPEPTHAAAVEAVENLSESVNTFPFVSDADLAALLAMILTTLFRRLLPSAPIGCVSATTPGTGKSKLVSVVSAIATGRPAAVTALGWSPEETEKRLDAALLLAAQLVCLDNVDRAVKSDVLCQILTEPYKTVRVLGLSKTVIAPTNVSWMMTGNNLTVVGDLVRRSVFVTLDAGCERPELRSFERDAVEYVLERRSSLIVSAITITRAYLAAGCPTVGGLPRGGFEAWDRMVRYPLMWAGMSDPIGPAEAMRGHDHELSATGDFLRAWLAVSPDSVTASELCDLIRARKHAMGEGSCPANADLSSAASMVMGDPARWDARALGSRLRSISGRIFDGLRVSRGKKTKAGIRWTVESVANDKKGDAG